MRRVKTACSFCNAAILAFAAATPLMAQPWLNELEPNPSGTDPDPASIELLGTPNAAFDLWVLSVEGDSSSSTGLVDRASNVTGSFDANGLAVVSVPDLENPSNTVILTDSFTGDTTTDIDPLDTGLEADLDLSTIGTIYDAVGIPDTADPEVLYGTVLGGVDLGYNGQFEPLLIFREDTTGDWYQTVTVDFGEPTEHVGIFGADGPPELETSLFATDPLMSTFGSANPALVPEPSAAALLLMSVLCLIMRRRR